MMRLLLILTITIFWGGLNAQTGVRWGISYAPSFAKIDLSTQKKYGQQILLQMEWNKRKRETYRLGLGHSFLQAENYDYYGYTDQYRHHDIILPFQLHYGLHSRPNRLYAVTGAMLSLNIKRNVFVGNRTLHYKWVDGFITLGLGYEFKLKNRGRIYIQPQYHSNSVTQFVYFLDYLIGRGGIDGYKYPPKISVTGIELGYFLH